MTTTSSRISYSDDTGKESIYKFFKKDNKKVGETIKIGSEEFVILKKLENTKSGIRGLALGNKATGKVEIALEGTTSPLEIFENPKQVMKGWSNNLLGNLRLTPDLPDEINKIYKSSEKGTPLSYEEAYKFSKEIQEEYKNEKNGFKGLELIFGHSQGGGAGIYIASQLNVGSVAVDPAPVNNPGKYLYNDKILRVIPNYGESLLSKNTITYGNDAKIETVSRFGGLLEADFKSGAKTDQLAVMRVDDKGDPIIKHSTSTKDVEKKSKMLVDEIKSYNSNKNNESENKINLSNSNQMGSR